MKQELYTWHSKQLDKDMSLFVYGQKGIPILAFPSENGSANDWEEHGMVEAIQEYIEKGRVQLFTVNTVDSESWFC
jgi:esterase/lipase superfamily enzyme